MSKLISPRFNSGHVLALLTVCMTGLLPMQMHAQSGTWLGASGNWSDTAIWSGGTVANGADFSANFTGVNITVGQTITLDANRTIGNITFTDATTSSHDLTISGANILNLDRTDATAPIIDVTQSGRTLTISSQISGYDGFTKNGAGILVLGGNNSVTGNVVVNGGTLQLAANNTMTDITVNGATLTSGGTSVGPGTLGLAGGTITFTGTSSFSPQRSNTGSYNKNINISSGTTTFNMSTQYFHETFSGVLSGSGTLVKNDSNGILTFSSASNTFTGAIRLDGGVGGMVVNSLADSASAITFNGNTGAFSLGSGTASSLLFNSRQIVLAHANGGAINNDNATKARTITINTNLGYSGAGTRTLSLGGANIGDNAFNGNIGNNGGSAVSVTKNGTGTWTLGGINSFTGATTITGGTLRLSNTAALANTSAIAMNTASSSLVLATDTAFTTLAHIGSASGAFTYTIVSDRATAGAGLTHSLGSINFTNATFNFTKGGNVTSGTAGLTFTSAIMTSGTAGTPVINPTGITLTITGGVTSQAGNVARTLQLDGTGTGHSIGGVITQTVASALSLSKTNSSTWTLAGTNTYSGTTSISGGILRFTGDSSGATGAVTVSGGALGGTGSLGGAVSLTTSGGIDLRDNAIGVLSLGSTLSSTGAAGANNLYFDLENGGSTVDRIAATGAFSMTTSGAVVINPNQLGGTANRLAAGTYDIITAASGINSANFVLSTTNAFGQTFALSNPDGTTLRLTTTQVTANGSAANLTLSGTNPSWTTASNFTGSVLPDYESNVTINSAIGTTGALSASQNINSLTYGSSATTATTITAGTAASGTAYNMLVIEARGVNGNTAGNGITLNNASGAHTISANIGITRDQTWTVASGATLNIGGVISDFGGGYGLTMAGGGTLAFTSASNVPTYSGVTTITGGIFDTSAFNSGTNASPMARSGGISFTTANSTFKVGAGTTTLNYPSISISGVMVTFDHGSSANNTPYAIPILTGTGTFRLTNTAGAGTNVTFGTTAGFTGDFDFNNTDGNGINTPDLTDAVSSKIRMSSSSSGQTPSFNYTGSSDLTLNNRQFELYGTTANTVFGINNNGTATFAINTDLAVTATGTKTLRLGGSSSQTSTFGGAITNGSGTIGITKIDSNTWSLTNAGNSFTGAISLSTTTTSAGTLAYASAGGANSIAFLQTTGSANLTYNGSSAQIMSGAITASALTTGTITFAASGTNSNATVSYTNTAGIGTSTSTGARNIIFAGSNVGNNTFAGAIANNTGAGGTATVTKNGAGTWVLSGTHTYTGATTVNSGKLLINGTTSTSAFTVRDAATLGGTGVIGGTISVASGATFAPGASIESLATGDLTMLAAAIYSYEMNNDALATAAGDLTAVTGNLILDLSNATQLSLIELGTGSWAAGEKITLISYSGAWNGGLFNLNSSALADDSTISFSGSNWIFNYNDTLAGTNFAGDLTGSSFVTMTAIPEPSVSLIGGIALLGMSLRRRRR